MSKDKAELVNLAQTNPKISIIKADLTNDSDLSNVSQTVTKTLDGRGLDVLINNAGISGRFVRLPLVKEKDLTDHFRINVTVPILLTKSLLPVLKKGQNKDGVSGIILNMGSILGSIQENSTGGFYPYRTSKAALNAATRSMSIDLKEQKIVTVSVHPGWVKTEMGGKHAPLTVEEAVASLIKFIEGITMEQNGLFFSYDGKQLPW